MSFTTTKLGKNSEKPLLGQILDLVPKTLFTNCVLQYQTDKHCSKYKTWDEFVSMIFGQLNKCLSLRDLSMGLSITPEFLNDIGLLQSPAKSTMSDGNAKRDYRVFEQLYYNLIKHYKNVFTKRPEYAVIEEIKNKNIKIIDSTTMSVCLNLFNWASFRTAKGGIKVHTSLDEALMIPEMIHITEAKVSDRRGVDNFRYPEDTIVVDDRGYFDFKLFKTRIDDKNHLVTRIKENTLYESVVEKELPEDTDFHILKDEIILLTGKAAKDAGIENEKFRRVAIYIEEGNRTVEVISNNLEWSAATIGELYRRRWLIETFFKLMKQNLQIKTFLGTSQNACKSQIFISLIAYFLLELIRRTISKVKHCFGHFVTLIRICLTQYNGLSYIVNEIKITVQKARKKNEKPKQYGQLKMILK